ncbi:DUF4826 family protein [Roseateles sp. SL47]|uniref:DUF4826 family protein n=1 Tax=Roseateles sp. SL47 TaxID=2995138 RepID=UPI00226D74B8|nr:DUF4826 family protein [Roseateles sp. SL47]WAC72660.1 DUF4826 family protein [Roseateles sp. SL47]
MTEDDDTEFEAEWLAERRAEILAYLTAEGINHSSVGDEPAWWVAPYVSIWAVEHQGHPGQVSGWAICGDLPSDYVSAQTAKSPREAMKAIASLWADAAALMARGERHPTFIIGDGSNDAELAPMLASRAELLQEWADDPDIWD